MCSDSLFGVHSIPMLPQWHVKDPNHSAKSVGGRSEWADYAAVQVECGNLSRNELTRNLSGNTWPQSSQLAEPLWTDPGLKSGISVQELISTLNTKQKRAGGGINGQIKKRPLLHSMEKDQN